MRRCLLALSMLFVGACAVAPSPSPVRAAVDALGSVWEVRTTFGLGSGSIIACEPADGHWRVVVLTAAHVLGGHDQPGYTVQLTKDDLDLNYGAVLAVHPSLDAALLVFESEEYLAPVALRFDDPGVMSRCYGVGFGGGKSQQWISGGHVCGVGRATIQGAPGDSGGAVLDEHGCLIGIIVRLDVFRRQMVWHHVAYVPLSALEEWIGQHG